LLRSAGLQLPIGVPPLISFRGKETPELLELELEMHARIFLPSSIAAVQPCPACGRIASSLPARIVVDQKSVPLALDIFRGQNFPTLIFATERFAKVVRSMRLTNIMFSEVALAE
jgi:hypothetical protein